MADATSTSNAKPAPARRFITGHDAKGNAVFAHEGDVEFETLTAGPNEVVHFGIPWLTRGGFPVDNSREDPVTPETYGGPVQIADGTILRITDLPVGAITPWHRSCSIDYDIILSGALYLELDEGEERRVAPGDVIVQRGTMHRWHNRGDVPARMIAVLIAAKACEIDGKVMGDFMDIPGHK